MSKATLHGSSASPHVAVVNRPTLRMMPFTRKRAKASRMNPTLSLPGVAIGAQRHEAQHRRGERHAGGEDVLHRFRAVHSSFLQGKGQADEQAGEHDAEQVEVPAALDVVEEDLRNLGVWLLQPLQADGRLFVP